MTNLKKESKPLLSVISVVFNAELELEKTILSVRKQTYNNIEHLVIDGGSTDGTVEIIKKYEDGIDYWVSEEDDGIYDGMNKGLNVCNGDLAIMLNAGDLFYSKKSVEKAISSAENLAEPFFGIAQVKSPFTSFFKPGTNIQTDKWLKGNLPIHQAVFIPRKYMHLRYNTNLKISADSDYMYKTFSKSQPQFVPVRVANFFLGGISSRYKSAEQFRNHLSERLMIIDRYQNHKIFRKIYTVLAFSIKYITGMLFSDETYYRFVRNGVKIKKLFS